MEKILLKTPDGLDVVGDYYYGKPSSKGALLLHMMPETRKSWWDFAIRLEDKGYRVLAIDLRGHGESSGGPNGYKKFSDEEHQKSIIDIETAAQFLEAEGMERSELALIGASIGANLALQYLAEHHQVKSAVLLSPGLNYRGIKTEPLIRKLKAGQRIFLATSLDDLRSGGNNAEMNQLLFGLMPEGVEKKLIVYRAAGHGTDMFAPSRKEEPDLTEEILKWVP